MKFVIDTSVAVKWFLAEAGHHDAVSLLETKAEFLAPDLIFTEFASTMQKKITSRESSLAQATASCASLPGLFASITPTLMLFQRALDIAVAMSHPVQDCIFLACAEQAGERVVTADKKLIEKTSKRGFAHLVFGLSDAVDAALSRNRSVTIPDESLQDLVRLTRRLNSTFDALRETHAPATQRFTFSPSDVFRPAFQSPAYVRLRDTIIAMPDDQLRDLMALCWLGRGYDGTDWSRLQDIASRTLGRTPSEVSYVLSLLSYLPVGIDRARVTQTPPAETHRDT